MKRYETCVILGCPCVEVTAGYYEMSLVGTIIDMLGLMYLGRLVEPIWGATEFAYFVIIVNLCVGACTFVTMYTLYIVTRSQFYLFAKFSGFHGILAALMVALRQLLPEERVPLPLGPLGSVFRVRNKHLPGLYCTVGREAAGNSSKRRVCAWVVPVYEHG